MNEAFCKILLSLIMLSVLQARLSAEEMKMPSLGAVKTGCPPKIDGEIAEAEWKSASRIEPFISWPEKSTPLEKTSALLMYDGKHN